MQCETKKEARRIAYFGAVKMASQPYRFEVRKAWETEGNQLRHGTYWVTTPTSDGYLVADNPFEQKRTLQCSCPFAKENWGICKHGVKVEWLLADAEEQARKDAEEDAWADEAMARMEALEGLEGDALTRKYGRA